LLSGHNRVQVFRAEIDPDLEKYIHLICIQDQYPGNRNIFGGDEILILIFETEYVLNPETLKRIKNIRKEMTNWMK